MITTSQRLLYYKRKDIQEAIVAAAEDKEIAVSYGGAGYGKRPDILAYPADVLEFAKKGVTSFHCSEELWINPLQIGTGMKTHEVNTLRKGWDLILDIDCDVWEYSKFAADLVVQALNYNGINSVTVKFSGNHGFHIGVPFEAFPATVHGEPTATLFPDGPRKIAAYLANMIKPHLAKKMLEFDGDINKIAARIDKKGSDLIVNNVFDPFKVLVIDTVLISSRHLYRMPYSFNEKSGWVSVPIALDHILDFDREKEGTPETVQINEHKFLDRSKVVPGEGSKLILQAFDHAEPEVEIQIRKDKKAYEAPSFALQEELFPPCITKLLGPLEDGKKRAMFVLTNFLSCVGWDADKIEERLHKWNEEHPEQLREVILKGHIAYHRKRKSPVLPPNCDNMAYYEGLRVCAPDGLCNRKGAKSIKNPVNYGLSKARRIRWIEENKKRDKEEREVQKEALRREEERARHHADSEKSPK
ncbi:MAG: DNA primase small subunit domain-containing protein [Candidatus Nanoarchaeia archaeon]